MLPPAANAQPTESACHALRKRTNALIGTERNKTVTQSNQSLAMADVTKLSYKLQHYNSFPGISRAKEESKQ